MGTFVDPSARVEVSFGADADHPGGHENTVWVKAKMDFRTRAAVQRELLRMKVDAGQDQLSGETTYLFGVLAQKLSLLKFNITRWRGPLFEEDGKLKPCKPETIDMLDLDEAEWWINIVKARIDELNTPNTEYKARPKGEEDPNPNGLTTSRELKTAITSS